MLNPLLLLFTLYLMNNVIFNGALIAQVLDDLGFCFGEKQIYHRHLDLSINSPILFSVANIEKPKLLLSSIIWQSFIR